MALALIGLLAAQFASTAISAWNAKKHNDRVKEAVRKRGQAYVDIGSLLMGAEGLTPEQLRNAGEASAGIPGAAQSPGGMMAGGVGQAIGGYMAGQGGQAAEAEAPPPAAPATDPAAAAPPPPPQPAAPPSPTSQYQRQPPGAQMTGPGAQPNAQGAAADPFADQRGAQGGM